eukprot:Lithocolla_globosa_v1_NODE_22_length_9343_cov_54.984819.p8 type:complete len:127 gc:universal NODE_22_length_9343_cov_54.984819:5241-5621(+)
MAEARHRIKQVARKCSQSGDGLQWFKKMCNPMYLRPKQGKGQRRREGINLGAITPSGKSPSKEKHNFNHRRRPEFDSKTLLRSMQERRNGSPCGERGQIHSGSNKSPPRLSGVRFVPRDSSRKGAD